MNIKILTSTYKVLQTLTVEGASVSVGDTFTCQDLTLLITYSKQVNNKITFGNANVIITAEILEG